MHIQNILFPRAPHLSADIEQAKRKLEDLRAQVEIQFNQQAHSQEEHDKLLKKFDVIRRNLELATQELETAVEYAKEHGL